jgi:hypothetical protein
MNKRIYKNITRFSLPIVAKTADGVRSTSFNLSPQKTFEISEIQVTGDINVKVKNKLLQLISEEINPGSTTEFLKVAAPTKVAPKVAPKPLPGKTYIGPTKESRLSTKETDNS